MTSAENVKNAYKLSVDDAFIVMIDLVKSEHVNGSPCQKCKKTLRMIIALRNRLNQMAIGSNLLWPILKITKEK